MKTKKYHFLVSLLFSVVLMFFLAATGFATEAQQPIEEPLPHPHYYPFTEVMGEYHLRLTSVNG